MTAERILRVFSCAVLVLGSSGYGVDRGRDEKRASKPVVLLPGEVSYAPLAKWVADSGLTVDVVEEDLWNDAAEGPNPCAPSFNGCGPVDFLGAIANCPFGLVCFEGACNVHDVCYGICGTPQLNCDFLFLLLMLSVCEDDFAPGTEDATQCNNLAFVYYMLVRVFGQTFYEDAQANVCQCSPNPEFAGAGGSDRAFVAEPPFADADADLMPDDWEIRVGLDPTRIDSFDDTDGDGLLNIAEYLHSMDPLDKDSDRDGVFDGVQAFGVQGSCCATP